jgi:hypothetical protein
MDEVTEWCHRASMKGNLILKNKKGTADIFWLDFMQDSFLFSQP